MKNLIENKIEELEKRFADYNVFETFVDYSGYIDEVVNSIADNNVEVYNTSLCEKSWDLFQEGYTERAEIEFGQTDLIGILQTADYLKNCDILEDNLDDLIYHYALHELVEFDEVESLTEEEIEDLMDEVMTDIDYSIRLSDIYDIVARHVEIWTLG